MMPSWKGDALAKTNSCPCQGSSGLSRTSKFCLGTGRPAGQVCVGEGAGGQGQDAGTFGSGADDFRVEALGLYSLRIDFERASGDEIKPAPAWRGKALHIVKSGQHPEVKGRDDFAHVEDDRPVFLSTSRSGTGRMPKGWSSCAQAGGAWCTQ